MKLLFVTNLCPHYREATFAALARRTPTEFVFYSGGGEWYWNARVHRRAAGSFEHAYLRGFDVGSTRIAPGLIARILRSDADVLVKCINGRFALPAAFLLARLTGKRFVLWTGIWHTPATRFHRLALPLVRRLYRSADAIVTYGNHVRDYVIEQGAAPAKVFVAPHSVDNDAHTPPDPAAVAALRAELRFGARPAILYVGRLEPEKGVAYLVAAVAILADLHPVLVLVGDGSQRAALAAQCVREQVDVRVVGAVAPADLPPYYASAAAFVLPSVTAAFGREPWGLVVNEAMNYSASVVASMATGAAAGGLVRDGETGLIVPERDPQALASALRRLLTDRDLACRLGRVGRDAVQQWSNECMVAGFLAAARYALDGR